MCIDQSVQKMMVMRLSLQEPAARKKTRVTLIENFASNAVVQKLVDVKPDLCSPKSSSPPVGRSKTPERQCERFPYQE